MNTSTSVNLTDQQRQALRGASLTKPIYAENPRFQSAQMPDGSVPVSLRTVKSLEAKGMLVSDGKGGYILTALGSRFAA